MAPRLQLEDPKESLLKRVSTSERALVETVVLGVEAGPCTLHLGNVR